MCVLQFCRVVVSLARLLQWRVCRDSYRVCAERKKTSRAGAPRRVVRDSPRAIGRGIGTACAVGVGVMCGRHAVASDVPARICNRKTSFFILRPGSAYIVATNHHIAPRPSSSRPPLYPLLALSRESSYHTSDRPRDCCERHSYPFDPDRTRSLASGSCPRAPGFTRKASSSLWGTGARTRGLCAQTQNRYGEKRCFAARVQMEG